jgi:hypothetical protein
MIIKEEVFTKRYQVVSDLGQGNFQVKDEFQDFTLWVFPKVDPKVLEIGSHPNLIEIVEILQGS